MNNQAVYLDTTILIALFIHAPKIKFEIREKIASYSVALTGQLAEQEFTRRLLKEAEYLLGQLKKRKTVAAVQRHLLDLNARQNRKFRICIQALTTIEEESSDEDNADRLKYFLEELLEGSLDEIRATVLGIVSDAGCSCAVQGIKRKGGSYTFPNKKCSSYKSCGITRFLEKSVNTVPLRDFLIDKKDCLTNELTGGMEFLTKICADKNCAQSHDPCLCFGDILISLESRQAGVFYTQNYKDSVLLCEQSGQQLLICQTNADRL